MPRTRHRARSVFRARRTTRRAAGVSGGGRRVARCSSCTRSGRPAGVRCSGPRTATGRPTGRSRALRSARPHPFAVPAATLAAIHPGTPTQVTLVLPGHGGGPLPSPELVRSAPAPAPRGEPELRAWAVPAVAVDPAELDDLADELRYGASVAHLRAGRRPGRRPRRPRPGPPDAGHLAARPPDRDSTRTAPGRRGRAGAPSSPGSTPRRSRRWPRRRPRSPARSGRDRPPAPAATPGATPPRSSPTPSTPSSTPPSATASPAPASRRAAAAPSLDTWLTALTSPDGLLPAGTRVGALTEALHDWDAVGTEPPGAARAVFRLAEVRALDESEDDTGDGTRWRLEFLLQSTTDPSLLVPAERVWAGAADRLFARPRSARPALRRAAVSDGALASSPRAAPRRCCSPSWAAPRGSTRRWPPRCAAPARTRSTSTSTAPTTSSPPARPC